MGIPTSARSASAGAGHAANQAAHSKTFDLAARLGFLAKGLVYVLIGLLAIQVALGNSQEADQEGALQAVSEQPFGSVVLWLMVVGFAAYAMWRFSEAAWGRRDESDEKKRTIKRIGSAANGVVYLAFGVLAYRTVTGGASSGGGEPVTAKVLEWQNGEALVIAAGVVVIAIAIGLAIRGLMTDFEKHLNTSSMSRTTFQTVRRLGQAGYVARGIVFALVGGLIIKAAVDHKPGKAEGFDTALKSVADAPYGKFLLIAAALGLICFGAYAISEARYRRIDKAGPTG